jgi:phenylalanyl-tRNA synthetase beta chain
MKLPLSCLKEHLETDASVAQLSATLTAMGLEVDACHAQGEGLTPFTVAQVLEANPHPNADRLRYCKVDTGAETLNIVCGAPNARAGIKVALARVGTRIPASGEVLKPSKIRGVDSEGMLCSARELQLGDDHDGILELPADAPIGAPITEVLGLNDVLFDLNITPDRGDCLGVYGVARDLAAAGLGTLKPLELPTILRKGASPVSVTIETDACALFWGCSITGVTNGESPDWLKQKLESVGLRPISALVDITNYFTIAYGRPLHVYDADRLQGGILVRDSRDGEGFEALNNKQYALQSGDCVIADESGVLGLGGIIGGTSTGCTETTRNVFLEAAWFTPSRIAAAGRRYQIDSDARYRFERSVDPAFTETGLHLATRMILELCGGTASEPVMAGLVPNLSREIMFRPAQVASLGGVSIGDEGISNIISAIGCDIQKTNEPSWRVTTPSWRPDLHGEADLVEEVLRLTGYDAIPVAALPVSRAASRPLPLILKRIQQARRTLALRGMQEIYSWSFLAPAMQALFPVGEAITLQNPISQDLAVMRPSLLPGLLQAVARNAAYGMPDTAFHEVRTVFHGTTPEAQLQVAGGVRAGAFAARSPHLPHRNVDCFDAKADALAALEACGAPVASLQLTRDAPSWYHPGKSGVLRLGKQVLAQFGELHPRVLKALEMDQSVSGFEVFLDAIPQPRGKGGKPSFTVVELQPVSRDFAFVVANDVQAGDVVRVVTKADPQLIAAVQVFDVYTGPGLAEGEKSLAVSVTLQPTARTFTDAEIEAIRQKIIGAVQSQVSGRLRA